MGDDFDLTERYVGRPVDDVPDAYDRAAVEVALDAKPPKKSKRIAWDDVDDLPEPEKPSWDGHTDLETVLAAGRCGCPVRNSVRRFGELRYCTRLPLRRMGQGNWQTGSDFCTHHEFLEKKAVPAREIFDAHRDSDLPYEIRL